MHIPDKVSLLVIGGGLTGLSTAITWALNNNVVDKPVLLLEKNSTVGGYVTSFRRKGFLFDTVQLIPDSSDVLNYFGLDIDLVKFEGYYARIFLTDPQNHSVKCINVPTGFKAFEQFLLEMYPHDAKAIARFFNFANCMFDELYFLKVEPTFRDTLQIIRHCPKIIQNSNKTFRQLVNAFGFIEPEIIEILDVFAAFGGLPAERVSALLPVSAMIASLNGSYRPQNGFIDFPLQMKKRLELLGGYVCTKTAVKKIIVKNGKAIGVRLANEKIIYADHIVTTIDPKVAMNQLVGDEVLRRESRKYANKVKNAKMSASAFMINLGLDDRIDLECLGFNCGYNLLTTGNGIFNKMYESYEKDELFMSRNEFYIPVICPSLPIGKKNALTIFVYPAAISDWPNVRQSDYSIYETKKQQIADFYIDLVQEYMIPNLKAHIVFSDIASPATFARYSGSPTGSKFDMAAVPENFGKNRLKMRTPIKNLYQPKFSHGIWPCLQAGIQVVDMMSDRALMNGNSRYGQ